MGHYKDLIVYWLNAQIYLYPEVFVLQSLLGPGMSRVESGQVQLTMKHTWWLTWSRRLMKDRMSKYPEHVLVAEHGIGYMWSSLDWWSRPMIWWGYPDSPSYNKILTLQTVSSNYIVKSKITAVIQYLIKNRPKIEWFGYFNMGDSRVMQQPKWGQSDQ